MNSNKILSSDVLDILFDKRNKNYGAYILRKFYPNRVKTSLLIMLGMSALFSAFTLLPEKKNGSEVYYDSDSLVVKQIIEIPKEIEQPKAAQKTPKPEQLFISRIVPVKDNESTPTLNDISDLAIGDHTEIIGNPGGTDDVPFIEITGTGDAPPTTVPSPAVDMNEPVDNPDVQASYPGGNLELRRFLEKNLQAPEENSEAVQVKVRFLVGFDGNLESFDIVQDGGIDFNKEVIRVLKKMPKWNPGKKGGRNVRVYYYLPVKFQPLD
jgi:periplasmic protein TonB